MQLLIFLSVILGFCVLASVLILRLWLNYQQRNVLNYDSAYRDEKNNINNRVEQTPKSFYSTSIHNYSKMLFGFGLMISSALVLFAFNWKSIEEQNLIENATAFIEEETILPIYTQILPPPPPKVQPINPTEIVEVDDINIDENSILVNIEDPQIDIKSIVNDVTGIDKANFQVEETEEIFEIVEFPAVFEGGMDNFYKYVAKNLIYPKQAKRQGIQGKIFLQFVVDKDGSITDIKVAKGLGSGLDEEATRVLRECPKWKPARQRGKVVKVRMSIPIMFKLN